jgi:hypothetical protein
LLSLGLFGSTEGEGRRENLIEGRGREGRGVFSLNICLVQIRGNGGEGRSLN